MSREPGGAVITDYHGDRTLINGEFDFDPTNGPTVPVFHRIRYGLTYGELNFRRLNSSALK
jgi:hypothetical protein